MAFFLAPFSSPAEEAAFEEPRLLREPAVQAVANPRLAISGLSSFQPAGVTSRLRRTMLQFEALLADEAWDEAIDLIEQLQAETSDELTQAPSDEALRKLIEDPESYERYVPVRHHTQQLLASLPPEGLEIYRSRIERSARKQVDEGISQLDGAALRRVVDRYAASSASRDALLALSELCLERGDTVAARCWLQQIDPLASDAFGRPAGVTLSQLDPSADPSKVAAVWSGAARPTGLTASPASETDESLTPLVLSRLALISLREGDLRRAAAEVRLLRGMAPEAVGRLAGRQQPLAEALEALLDESASSSSAQPERSYGDFAWAWDNAATLEPPPVPQPNPRRGVVRINGNLFGRPGQVFGSNVSQLAKPVTPSIRPVVAGSTAYYAERGKVKQLDLTTGDTSEFKLPGKREASAAVEKPKTKPKVVGDIAARRFVIGGANGRQIIQFGQPAVVRQNQQPISITRVSPDLAVTGGRLYVRTTKTTRQPNNRRQLPTNEQALLGFDPKIPGEIALRITIDQDAQAVGTGYQFGGPPTVRGDRLYVTLTRPGTRTEVAVACYSVHSARELWRTEIGAGEPTSRFGGGASIPVTLVGDTLYLATEMGTIASLDSPSGTIRWISNYARDKQLTPINRAQPPQRSALPCVVVGDRVIAAPTDSTKLLAWDAGTGRPLWESPRSQDAKVAGVAHSPNGAVVILSGRQIASYDSLTGVQRFAWPESDRAGLRGIGAATVVGGEVFWPTRDALYSFDPATGVQTRPPIDLAPVGAAGANVVPTNFGLLLVGPARIRPLAALDPIEKSEPAPPLSRLIETSPGSRAVSLARPGKP